MKTPAWTKERLAAMETAQLKQLFANAEARGAEDIAAMCREVLAERGPAPRAASTGRAPSGKAPTLKRGARDYVAEFHFVCENDRGVTQDGERFFWTGSWTVAEDQVIRAIEEGSKLALHKSSEDMSYRQGKIIDYRKVGDAPKKRNVEIDFLIAADEDPLPWFGDGAGEAGYRWASDAQPKKQSDR